MNCIVTAGPTFEPVDQVRRLSNLSTGQLGGNLANFLVDQGHAVHLLLGEMATWGGPVRAQVQTRFTTTSDLHARLEQLAAADVDAVFHAAAVSDFAVAGVWTREPDGALHAVPARKIPSQLVSLFLELRPTLKIIACLRRWFPAAVIVGWKYEVEGTPADALAEARLQIQSCGTSACVVNGLAYGAGYGLVTADGASDHFASAVALYRALERCAGA